jgi:hypothetical protein
LVINVDGLVERAEGAGLREAQGGAVAEGGLVAGGGVDRARAETLGVLDGLLVVWLERARTGDAAAAGVVLGLLKQRTALLGLVPRPAPAQDGVGERGEVKLVVEYVNDWREVLRRRA